MGMIYQIAIDGNSILQKQKSLSLLAKAFSLCRGGGIRTPGTSRYNGFQDRRIRPLCHSSLM